MGDSLFDALKAQQEAKNKTEMQEPDNELAEKLQEVGDACQVNPPKPPATVVASKEKQEPVKQSAAEGMCPTCGKKFKHLSRHKCKVKRIPDEELTPEELETLRILDEKKFELDKKLSESTEESSEITKTVQKAVEEPEPTQNFYYDLALDTVLEKKSDQIQITHFSDIILPLCDMVASENQTENWNTIQYAVGPGLLSRKLENYLQKNMPTGILLADSSTPECRACKEVLKKYARNILQGVR